MQRAKTAGITTSPRVVPNSSGFLTPEGGYIYEKFDLRGRNQHAHIAQAIGQPSLDDAVANGLVRVAVTSNGVNVQASSLDAARTALQQIRHDLKAERDARYFVDVTGTDARSTSGTLNEVMQQLEPSTGAPEAAGALPPEPSTAAPDASGGGVPPPPPPTEPPTTALGAAPDGGEVTGQQEVLDGVRALAGAFRRAKALKPEQLALQKAERGRRVAVAASMLEKGSSAEASTGALKGNLGRVTLRPPEITPRVAQLMTDHIERGPWTTQYFDHITAKEGFQKIINGEIPTDSELALLQRAFPGGPGKELVEAVLSHRSFGAKAFDEFVGAVGLPQLFSTAFDASAGFRQMAIEGAGHPVHWARAMSTMRKAATDPAYAARIMDDIATKAQTAPFVADSEMAKVYSFDAVGGRRATLDEFQNQGEREGQLAGRNRSVISRLAQQVPGIKASERVYTVPINKLRVDIYNDVAARMWNSGVRDVKQFEGLAKVGNHGTGYGAGPVGQITSGVNAFFSPRNLTARFQVVLDPFTQPGSLLKASARQEAAKNLIAFATYNATVLALLKASGVASVELDPRSSDWGKAKIGNQRLDFMAGYGPMVRLAVQLGTLQRKNTLTGQISAADPTQLVTTFMRNKLGPLPGFVVDAFKGENAVGDPTKLTSPSGWGKQFYDHFVPFFAQDVTDAWRHEGAGAAGASLISFAGLGVQTYEPSAKQVAGAQVYKSGYDAAPDQIWQTIQGSGIVPPGYKNYDDFRAALVDVMRSQFASAADPDKAAAALVDGLPAVNKYQKLVSDYRNVLIKNDPTLKDALIKIGARGYTKEDLAKALAATP